MRKADVEELFQLVAVGDSVELVETAPEDLAHAFHPAAIQVAFQAAAGGAE